MKTETAKTILYSYGINLKLLENFAPGCISIQNCINKMIKSVEDNEEENPIPRQDSIFKIMTDTIAELSFRNNLAFRYAFELEQKKINQEQNK